MFSWIFPKLISADLHNFRFWWLHALNFRNLSNCCKHKYDSDNFTYFLLYFLAGFCHLKPLCHTRAHTTQPDGVKIISSDENICKIQIGHLSEAQLGKWTCQIELEGIVFFLLIFDFSFVDFLEIVLECKISSIS